MSAKRLRKIVYVYACQCMQCGHTWQTRDDALPDRCPVKRCRSTLWNGPPRLRPFGRPLRGRPRRQPPSV